METEFVLFDFDGVIANTEESNAAYLEKALGAFGIRLTEEDKRLLIGTNDKTAIEALLSRAPVKVAAEELARMRKEVGNTYENSDIRPMPGVVSLIQHIRGRGMKTGLVTSTSTRLIMIALNRMKMTSLFDVVVCGDMCTNLKPDQSRADALCLRIPPWAYTPQSWPESGWQPTGAQESHRM